MCDFEFEQNEYFDAYDSLNLDDVLKNNENRKPNKLGMYRTTAMVVASSGFGKTTTVLKSLLSGLIDDYGLIMIMIPRESLDSGYYKSLYNYDVPGFMFVVIGEEPLPSIESIAKISEEVKKPIAVVLDDYVNALDKAGWLTFKRYITQLSRVHYGASLFALCQDLYTLKPMYRKGFNTFIIFPASLTEMQFKDILRNYYTMQAFESDELKKLYQVFKKDKHGSLWLINNNDATHSMMFNNVWIKKIK